MGQTSMPVTTFDGAAPAAPRTTLGQRLAERGWIPDRALRRAIQRLLRGRLADEYGPRRAERLERQAAFRRSLGEGRIAVATRQANEQHYEVPPAFYREVLGARLKYSSGHWSDGATTLTAAEESMLRLSCERAGIQDGMDVFDLGCGWGSLALYIAEHYPAARVFGLSNSAPQRQFILDAAAARGLRNVEVHTADINDFETERRFDRIVSVEMFEHMRNWRSLLANVASWLRDDGRAFVHTFCHRELAYPYETERSDDWMGRFFFTGGIMPSVDTISWFTDDVTLEDQWRVNGLEYARTARAWLRNLDDRRETVLPILGRAYGEDHATVWLRRWRLFFLACEELFRFRGGTEWFVSHSLLRRVR